MMLKSKNKTVNMVNNIMKGKDEYGKDKESHIEKIKYVVIHWNKPDLGSRYFGFSVSITELLGSMELLPM